MTHKHSLTASEINTLLAHIEEPRDRALFLVMINAGLKLSEAEHLSLQDIKWNDNQVKIPKKRGKYEFINKQTQDALEQWTNERPKASNKNVFVSLKGNPDPLSSRGIDHIIRTYGEKAGLGTISARTLRNTFLETQEPDPLPLETPEVPKDKPTTIEPKEIPQKEKWVIYTILGLGIFAFLKWLFSSNDD